MKVIVLEMTENDQPQVFLVDTTKFDLSVPEHANYQTAIHDALKDEMLSADLDLDSSFSYSGMEEGPDVQVKLPDTFDHQVTLYIV